MNNVKSEKPASLNLEVCVLVLKGCVLAWTYNRESNTYFNKEDRKLRIENGRKDVSDDIPFNVLTETHYYPIIGEPVEFFLDNIKTDISDGFYVLPLKLTQDLANPLIVDGHDWGSPYYEVTTTKLSFLNKVPFIREKELLNIILPSVISDWGEDYLESLRVFIDGLKTKYLEQDELYAEKLTPFYQPTFNKIYKAIEEALEELKEI